MKAQVTHIPNKMMRTLGFFALLMMLSVSVNTLFAQTPAQQTERTITGVISNQEGPLESASVILKGGTTGTTTNSKGEFTFPKALKTGDVLVVTYLGFLTQEVKIKDGVDVIRLTLSEDLYEFSGAPNSDKPYKSKRTK